MNDRLHTETAGLRNDRRYPLRVNALSVVVQILLDTAIWNSFQRQVIQHEHQSGRNYSPLLEKPKREFEQAKRCAGCIETQQGKNREAFHLGNTQDTRDFPQAVFACLNADRMRKRSRPVVKTIHKHTGTTNDAHLPLNNIVQSPTASYAGTK